MKAVGNFEGNLVDLIASAFALERDMALYALSTRPLIYMFIMGVTLCVYVYVELYAYHKHTCAHARTHDQAETIARI